MKIRLNSDGITLIEVIVSTAIIAILSIMLIVIMTAAFAGINTTHKRTTKAMNAAGQIESEHAKKAYTNSTASSVDMQVNTDAGIVTYSIDGLYTTDDTGTYTEFIPD